MNRRTLPAQRLALGVLLVVATAQAGTISITGGSINPPNTWQVEPGGSIPAGTMGIVNGVMTVNSAGLYAFIYGGGGLLPGDTGHGDTTYANSFWVGPDQATAAAAGHIFCTSAQAACGGLATPVGKEFNVFLNAGSIPFGFTFGVSGTDVLRNGDNNTAIGAYMAQIGLNPSPFAGPGLVGYIGLTDRGYPTPDDDFQDLVVTVAETPEPATMALLGAGLVSLGFFRRRHR